MKTVVIIQARLGSTRLPRKVLLPLNGKTVLQNVIERAELIKNVDQVVLATTNNVEDDVLIDEAKKHNVSVYRGSEEDVLNRYYNAALMYKADHIVRITSDCPLIDPVLSSNLVSKYFENNVDYAHTSKFPRGLDTEVFSFLSLEKCEKNATRNYEREHVTPYIYENRELFSIFTLSPNTDCSNYRWTVDTIEDYDSIKLLCGHLLSNKNYSWKEMLRIVEDNPEISQINQYIIQKKLGE